MLSSSLCPQQSVWPIVLELSDVSVTLFCSGVLLDARSEMKAEPIFSEINKLWLNVCDCSSKGDRGILRLSSPTVGWYKVPSI